MGRRIAFYKPVCLAYAKNSVSRTMLLNAPGDQLASVHLPPSSFAFVVVVVVVVSFGSKSKRERLKGGGGRVGAWMCCCYYSSGGIIWRGQDLKCHRLGCFRSNNCVKFKTSCSMRCEGWVGV